MKKENLKRLRKYAMKEAWRVHKSVLKLGYPSSFSDCIKRSWNTGRKLLSNNEDFIFYTDN